MIKRGKATLGSCFPRVVQDGFDRYVGEFSSDSNDFSHFRITMSSVAQYCHFSALAAYFHTGTP